jgi:TPR repeat protein
LSHHEDDSTQTESHLKELQADEWVGIALRKMGASLSQAQQCMQKSKVIGTPTHPARSQRMEAIKQGYYQMDLQKAIRSFEEGDCSFAYKILTHKDIELNAAGYCCLAQLQAQGCDGAVKDTLDAIENYKKAIQEEAHYCPAYEGLAKLYDAQQDMVLMWLQKAALKDCPKALTYLGYYREQRGDYVVAAKCYEKAASLKDPKAWHNLAYLYQDGRGVIRNEQKEIECHQEAANLGFKKSIEYLKNRGLLRRR